MSAWELSGCIGESLTTRQQNLISYIVSDLDSIELHEVTVDTGNSRLLLNLKLRYNMTRLIIDFLGGLCGKIFIDEASEKICRPA